MTFAEQVADTQRPPPPTIPAPPPFKSCRCGCEFDADEWEQLPLVGTMDDGEGGTLVLRNCLCGSTIAILIGESQ